MLTRRQLVPLAAAAPLLGQSRPKNILLLIADDLGRHLGCYGDAQAKTPNIDEFARQSVRFENAFATTASCSASRSVILSGLQNHTNGQYGHAHAEHNLSYLPAIQPLPKLLKNAGYKTGVLGKLHVNPLSRFEWDLDGQKTPSRNVTAMAAGARKFIEAAGNAPWYLHMGYTDPHRDGNGFANRDYPGVTRNRFDPAKVKVPAFLPDNPPTREEVAEYYEACNRFDQGVGMMIALLKEKGIFEDTLVIVMSDNGMPFANAKTGCYDAGLRLPLILRAPGRSKPGMVTQAMASWVDILPTAVDWAGAKLPSYPVHGRSLLPAVESESAPGPDEVYFSHTFHEITMYYPMRGVRTRRYKYIRNLFPELEFPHASDLYGSKTWQSVIAAGETAMVGKRPVGQYLHRPAEELYDITQDPDEVVNLAGKPEHKATLEELRAKVTAYRKQTKDPWLVNDEYQKPK
jgi:N-sulfoglucosamine sulfohydrolase